MDKSLQYMNYHCLIEDFVLCKDQLFHWYNLIILIVFFCSCSSSEVAVDDKVDLPNVIMVGQWNTQMFGIQDGIFGIPNNDSLGASINSVKEIINKLNCDILFFNEYHIFLDQEKMFDTYETLLKSRYPFFYYGGFHTAIASVFPLEAEDIHFNSRKFVLGQFLFRNATIGFACIHPIPYIEDYSKRIADHNQVISLLNDYDLCLVAGDFNTNNQIELDSYVNNGFILGNYGSFGRLVTHPSSNRSLDNIVIKGLSFNSFSVINSTSVSDHYPIFASVSTYSNK